MARHQGVQSRHDGVARLVEAERAWQASLEAAKLRAGQLVAEARVEVERRQPAAAKEIQAVVEARRQQLEADLTTAVNGVNESFAARIARYSTASEPLLQELAATVAAENPWFGQPRTVADR